MTEYLASVVPAPAPAALNSNAESRRSWTDGANVPTPLQQLPNGGLESNGAATLSGERRRRTSRELVGLESGLSATPREATVLRVDTRPDTPSGHWSSPTSRRFFAERVPWRARVSSLALIVGLVCGVVAAVYMYVLELLLDLVWKDGGPTFAARWPDAPPWAFTLLVCTVLGGCVGVLIHVLGEPLINLVGVVSTVHRDGLLGHREAPAMAAISLVSITAAGSLGPEAPLVSIGGGIASFLCIQVDLSEAETLFVTMCGMGAGLAAFFGEPIGGALFACEVLHRWGLEYYEAMVPTIIAGLACNWSFRVASGMPQQPIWTFAPEPLLLPWTSILGVVWGAIGGGLGWLWMRFTNWVRVSLIVRWRLGNWHVAKGVVGGLLIGAIGALHPETLFWAEHEAQTIIDHGSTPLPHVWNATGVLGEYSLADPFVLLSIGLFKMLAITVTMIGGFRGGFIFPFMFAGHAIGTAVAIAGGWVGIPLSHAAGALCTACAINVAVTRTVIATPIVLASLSGRPDTLPTLLVASLVSLWVTADESVIKDARKRWLRVELEGCDAMEDPSPDIVRRRSRLRRPHSTDALNGRPGSAML